MIYNNIHINQLTNKLLIKFKFDGCSLLNSLKDQHKLIHDDNHIIHMMINYLFEVINTHNHISQLTDKLFVLCHETYYKLIKPVLIYPK